MSVERQGKKPDGSGRQPSREGGDQVEATLRSLAEKLMSGKAGRQTRMTFFVFFKMSNYGHFHT